MRKREKFSRRKQDWKLLRSEAYPCGKTVSVSHFHEISTSSKSSKSWDCMNKAWCKITFSRGHSCNSLSESCRRAWNKVWKKYTVSLLLLINCWRSRLSTLQYANKPVPAVFYCTFNCRPPMFPDKTDSPSLSLMHNIIIPRPPEAHACTELQQFCQD
jgi:hypothetical protein